VAEAALVAYKNGGKLEDLLARAVHSEALLPGRSVGPVL
jgi:hypothetical protein